MPSVPLESPYPCAPAGPRRTHSRTDWMRWIDHWIGLPLCFALGLIASIVRRVLPERRRQVTGQRPIAVFKFFGLGSILQATPMLRAIRATHPGARLLFVTFDINASLVRQLDVCDELYVIRTTDAPRFIVDVVRTILACWWCGVEAVIDLEFFAKFSTLLAFLTRAPIRVGFHLNDFWRYSLVTHPIYFNYYRHITDVYAHAASRLHVTIDDHHIGRVRVDDHVAAAMRRRLEQAGWSASRRLIGVNINAGDICPERRWPRDRFAAVITTLLERHAEAYVLLSGAPEESAWVQGLVEQLPSAVRSRAIVAAGGWSLEMLIAAVPLCEMFLTNDSGPMHLAAAAGVPIVSLWGPSRPDFYAPKDADNHILYHDYPCSPCMLMFTTFEGLWCNHEGWCMHEIRVDEVLDACEAVLQRTH